MKILVDINNKILKVLENDRSIFKGEQRADKLILYINQQLVNEYPVITGLLSNGRRIGPFTTDSSYGTETIEETTYTTAEFTLSKENGFTLTEGTTEITIWIYKTKDTEVISQTAIGNITFNVVNTTSFNDGDIIISGDVEGTVVNIKVELENLQSSVNAVNSRVNDLNGVVVKKIDSDISTNKTLQELYDEYGSCFVGKVGYNQRNVLFLFYKSTTQTNLTVCHGSNLKTYENVNMNLNVASVLTDSLGNPTYSNSYTDKKIDELIANLKSSKVSIYTPSYSIPQGDEVVIRKKLTYDILTQPYTSSVIVAGRKYIAILDVKGGPNKQVKLFDFISNTYYETSVIDTSNLTDYNTISFSTKSYYDKSKIDSLMSQKADKSTTYTKTEVDNKIWQVNDDMANNYMELESMIEESRNEIEDRENLVSIIGNATETLAGVMSAKDKKNLNTLVALLQDDENNIVDTINEVLAIFEQYPEGANLVELLADKVNETTYNAKVEELEENISDLDNIKIEIDSLTAKNNIKNYQEVLWLGSDEIPEIPTQLPFGSSTDLITFLEGLKNLWTDIDSELIEQYGYNRVVFLGLYGGKLVKVDTVKASSGNYNTRVHSSIYKANVKECISLNTNKRYKLINDTYETPQEPSYFLEEIPYLVYDKVNESVLLESDDGARNTDVGAAGITVNESDENTGQYYFSSISSHEIYLGDPQNNVINLSLSEDSSIHVSSDYGTGSFTPTSIYLEDLEYGTTFEVYLEDGYVSFGKYEDAYFKFTVHGVSGRDADDNEFNFNWATLADAGKRVYNYTEDGGVVSLNTYSLSICPYANGPMAEISAEDGYIKLGGGEGDAYVGNMDMTPEGLSGEDRYGSIYYIKWRDIYRSLGQIYVESLYASDEGDGIFVFPLTYCASSLDMIFITVSKASTNEVHDYLWEPGSSVVWKEDTKEFIPLLDDFTIGGLVDSEGLASVPNDIAFHLGDYIAEGDEIEIEYIGNKFSPMVIM